ncbi:MAG: alanine--tRNA ligase-related protein [Candidatus Berkelbacteria bacterium]|nr:alanine--tRNA ligase-related protein [Candidatus Berkelbacteria bacterium]
MTSSELRVKFLEFFKERGHKVIPSSSLVPENDPSVLFTTAGMHPLVPYLLGEKHPLGNRLCDVQKCLRTDDIDEVGDAQHCTFFEMLGYWSLGDYFKKESIHYTFDFYTEVLGFNKDNISVTVFAGDDTAPFDQESFDTWKNEIGIPEERIYKYGRKENWWGPVGATGPCGPDTEMFIDTGIDPCGPDCGPSCNCDKFIEIGNNVFMEFNKISDTEYEPLAQKNVDVGLGLERLAMFSQGKTDVFQIDTFEPIIKKIEQLSGKTYQGNEKAFRIIADHLRAASFAIGDGAIPSNKGAGYVVRRLIRRAIRYSWLLEYEGSLESILELIISESPYEMRDKKIITSKFKAEEEQFSKIIDSGLKQVEKVFANKTPISQEEYSKVMQFPDRREILREIHSQEPNDQVHPEFKKAGINMTNRQMHEAYVSGKEGFDLYQTYGLPHEILLDLGQKRHLFVSKRNYQAEVEKHQALSRTASAGMFKGGLADNKVETTRLHTAAHLLLAALRQILSPEVSQKGSNITEERLRFDFNWPEKLTPEQIAEVEKIVNEKIKENIPVEMEELSLEDAKKSGASGVFDDRYGEIVKVYNIGPSTLDGRSGSREFFSREICGGPHVASTGELGTFKITKEESSSAGVRRIKAILE